jgi:hypothetical protein
MTLQVVILLQADKPTRWEAALRVLSMGSFDVTLILVRLIFKPTFSALKHHVLPIVMGARKVDYVRVAPPNSFVHVDDFKSPRHLARFLLLLDAHAPLYAKYFRWKGAGQACISWGIHELPKALLGPDMPYHSDLCGQSPLKRSYGCFREVSLWQSHSPLGYLMPCRPGAGAVVKTKFWCRFCSMLHDEAKPRMWLKVRFRIWGMLTGDEGIE